MQPSGRIRGRCVLWVFILPFLLPNGNNSRLATPFPSARTGDCLAAARSRRGSDMPPACHSLPRRRFATLKGAALRGKDYALAQWGSAPPLGAPFRGVVGVSRLRGRQIRDQSRVEKRERTKYCEGRLLSRPSRFLSYVKYIYQKHRGEAVIGDDGDEVVHGRDQRP